MNWFLNLIRRKPIVKILALIGAVILWSFVMQDQNPMIDTSYRVPVTMLNAPEGSKVEIAEESVRIKLRGARSAIAAVDEDDLKAVVNLNGFEPGTHKVKIHTVIPQGVEAVEISPDTVEVTIDPIVQRTMEVTLIRGGQIPKDMAVADISSEPSVVTVEGPSSAVKNVAQVVGYVGFSKSGDTDFDLTVPLTAIGDDGIGIENVHVVPKNVRVHVQLARGLSKKIVDVKPLFEGTLPSGYMIKSARIEPARIEIAGESSALSQIASLTTEPIALSELTKTTRKAVLLNLPDGITVTNRMVFVNIEIEKE